MSESTQFSGSYIGVDGHEHVVSYFPRISDFMGFCARLDRDAFFTNYDPPEGFFDRVYPLMRSMQKYTSAEPVTMDAWEVTHDRDSIG